MKRLARHFASVGALSAATVLLAQPAPPSAPSGADGSPPSKEAWDFRGIKGEILRTPHYRVYTTERDTVLKGRLTETLELALAQYRSAIVDLPAPTRRLDVYLMDERRQWETVTKLLMGEQSEQLLLIPSGGYASRGIGVYYDIGLYGTVAISAHEGWHQYTQQVFRDGLPVWMEEGLASFMEGHRWDGARAAFRPWANLERFDQLRRAHAGGRIKSLEVLLSTDPKGLFAGESTAALDYYAQVWALVHFLNEGEEGKHREGLRTLLADAASGRLNGRLLANRTREEAAESIGRRIGPAVMREYFGEDLAALGEAYVAFIERVVGVGGRERVVAGESPAGDAGDGLE